MGDSTERPRAATESPDVNQTEDLLELLLETEKERLKTAVRIEGERKIVFPETSVIIHDIMRIQEALDLERRKSKGTRK